jgi:hypothetical protein
MQELKNHEINFEVDLKSMEKDSEQTKDFYGGGSPYVVVGPTPYIIEKDKEKEEIMEGI